MSIKDIVLLVNARAVDRVEVCDEVELRIYFYAAKGREYRVGFRIGDRPEVWSDEREYKITGTHLIAFKFHEPGPKGRYKGVAWVELEGKIPDVPDYTREFDYCVGVPPEPPPEWPTIALPLSVAPLAFIGGVILKERIAS